MTKVCYWDSEAGEQKERDMTPEEEAQRESDIAAAAAGAASALIKQIDADTDGIYAAAIGNRGPEYDQASSDATAFKAAGYTGAVPASVQSWATAKSWTAQQAADDILAAAARLTAARDAIRANRLLRKEQARAATTQDQLAATQAAWEAFIATIRAQLGI